MAHKHSVYDTDAHFSINPITRVLKNEASTKTNVIQFDHNSERFTFEIPRKVEDHDMSLCNVIQIHYINIDSQTKAKNVGVYEVDDLQISPESDDVVILSWLISQNATQLVGSLNFLIRFMCVSDDGTVDYVWNTAIYSGISVSSGIYNGEVIVEEYADILAQWEARITALEQGGGTGGTAGEDGEDGGYYSPTVSQVNENTMRVTFTPSKDDMAAIPARDITLPAGKDGNPGADGQDGTPGKDGVSVTHEWDGTVLKVTSASGTSSADLKGDPGKDGNDGQDGYTPQKGVDYFDGKDGQPGADGVNGKDGTSPVISVSTITGGHRITITDVNGTKTVDVMDGEDGQDGSDGQPGSTGSPGENGQDGSDGVGIASIKQTTTSTADGGNNVFTVTLTNGTSATFTVKNGSKGSTGTTGTAGKDGVDGKTAYQYAQDGGYTGSEAEFAEKLASEYTINPLWGKKISLLGDSICAGSDDDTSYLGGYGKIIADRNNMVYENVAHGGATVTAETYSRTTGNAKPWLCRMVENMSADADYAIIEGGINDGWDTTVQMGSITTGYDATLDDTTYYGAFESMLKQLVTKFQGKKIGYIAVPKIHSLFDSNQNVPNFYHAALECCAKWGISVCDLNTITPPVEYLADLGTEYTADACHPTYEGYLKYYCDPIEAWMKTLITSGGNNNTSVSSEVISDINSKITVLETGKLSNTGVSFRKALLPLADGTTIEIDVLTAVDGTLVVKYVNRVPISIDADGTVYGVDYDEDGTKDGYKKAYRLSASSGSEKAVDNASLVGFVPVKAGDIVRFKYIGTNACWDTYSLNQGHNVIAYYDGSFSWLGSICPLQSGGVVYGICTAADASTGSVADGGIVSFTVPSNTSIAYLRLSLAIDNVGDMSLSNLIVTVNEEIT